MTKRARHYPRGALPGWRSEPIYAQDLFGRRRAIVHRYVEYDVPGLLEQKVDHYVVNQVTAFHAVLGRAAVGHIRVQLLGSLREPA